MDQYLENQADNLLREIGEITAKIEKLEAEAEAEIAGIREKYSAQLRIYKDDLDEADKSLIWLMKQNKAPLFDGRDKISLANGILFYAKELKLSLARDALAKIEEQGWTEAIKIAKSVDRSIVEQWPDERLFLIGAVRKLGQKFAYEIKDD